MDYLESSNLFIIPLDNRRQWYRYHHLFADLLSSRLRSSDPMHVLTLHSRASQWFEHEGLFSEAVDHALLADDFPGALRLIEQQASRSIWASGDLPILINWSKRLPEEELIARPRLSLYYARGLFFSGQVEAARRYLQGAEKALLERNPPDETVSELLGVLFTNQATFAAMYGESEVALNLARQAQPLVAAGDASTQARIAHAVGMAEYLQGNVQKALPAFSRAAGLCRQSGNRLLGLDVVALLGQMLVAAGRIGEALKLLEEELGRDPGIQQFPAACALYLALAEIEYEKDDLHQAKSSIERSLELGQKANWPHILWQAYLLHAQVEAALGNWDGSQAVLLRAEILSSKYPIPYVSRMVSAASARLQLASGDLAPAARWAEEYLSQRAGEGLHDFEELTLAGILCEQNRLKEALAVLDSLSQFAAATGRKRTEIQVLALRSRILAAEGKSAAAQETLTAARQLAGLEPFARSFTDYRGLAGEAFKTIRVEEPSKPGPSNLPVSRKVQQPLLEPLSERELEVLSLIAAGLSNPEIAARLYLSVNTLRAHSSNIFRKLDVHNRVQAVSRGRELGLLPDQ